MEEMTGNPYGAYIPDFEETSTWDGQIPVMYLCPTSVTCDGCKAYSREAFRVGYTHLCRRCARAFGALVEDNPE